MKNKMDITRGSGNVFRDLAVAAPEEALAKAELTAMIAGIISDRRLTQSEAARILGLDQPKVSALLRGRLSGFSTERILRFLTVLGNDVDIVIRSKNRKAAGVPGHLHVRSA